jgi:hypothetical protein
MGNAHHPAEHLLALVASVQHFPSQYGFNSLKAKQILLRSQIMFRLHVRSVYYIPVVTLRRNRPANR